MNRDERDALLLDATDHLKSFAEAKSVTEAEEHYRALNERLIPTINADDRTAGSAVELAFRALIDAKIVRRYIPAI